MNTDTGLSQAIFSNNAFLEAYESGTFWRGNLDAGMLKNAFSWQHLNEALSTHRITNDRLRLSRKEASAAANKAAFRSTRDSFGRPTDHLLINELHQQLQSGTTGIFESVHEIFPDLEALIESLSSTFYARSAANAYISFGTVSGFGVHNDDHDVLVCQVEGKKRWNFFGSPSRKCKATILDLPQPCEADITESLVLSEGDMLFVPKGTWHDVESMGEPSLHLTISLVYPSVQNFLEWLLMQNKLAIPYLDIRLQNENFDHIAKTCREFLTTEISESSVATFIKTYYAKYPSIRTRPCFPNLNTPHLTDRFQIIPFSFLTISNVVQQDDTCWVTALGKKYTLSLQAFKLLSEMQVGKTYSGKQLQERLSTHFDSWIPIAAALTILLDHGLITKRPPIASQEM